MHVHVHSSVEYCVICTEYGVVMIVYTTYVLVVQVKK